MQISKGSTGKTRKLGTLEDFEKLAEIHGVKLEKEEKMGLFRKTIDIISRPLYASAGFFGALTPRGQREKENPLTEAWEGFTGQEKETFSDVLKDVGVENKWARGIAGFALDVVLDPATYVGGRFIKMGLKGISKVGGIGVKGLEKVAPNRVIHMKEAANTIGDAFKKAFIPTYGLTKKVTKLKLDGVKYTDDMLEGITIKGDKVLDQGENVLGILDNGVIKDVTGKTQIGSFTSAFEKSREALFKSVQGYDKILTKNEKIFSEFSAKQLEKAGEIMIENRKITKGIYGRTKPGVVKPIVKEARKYKSVDEFVKSQDVYNPKKYAGFDPEIGAFQEIFSRGDELVKTGLTKRQYYKTVKGIEGKTVMMSPDDYIEQVAKGFKMPVDDLIKTRFSRDIKKVKEIIQERRIDVPWLEYKDGFFSQEGLHRALALKELGVKEMPVRIIYDTGKLPNKLSKFKKLPTKSQLADTWKKAQKVKPGAAITGDKLLTSTDEGVNKAIGELQKLGKQYWKDSGLAKAGYKYDEWYTPFVDKKYLKEARIYKDTLEKGEKNYLKTLKAKLPEKDIVNDPIKTFTRREYEISHDVTRTEALKNMITAFGKKFKSTDDALAAGYKPIYKKAGYEAAEKGTEMVGMKKPMGYLLARDAKFVNQALYPEFKTIDMLAKASGYDSFTRLFKTAVTAWFPAFHIRNYISGMVQNYSVLGRHAFDPETIFKDGLAISSEKMLKSAASDAVVWGGKEYTLSGVRKALIERFGYSSRYVADLEQMTDVAEGILKFKKAAKLNPKRLGNWIEMNQKANATVGALKRGKTLEEALNIAEKAGFDYSKITQFESKVMKRLIPFYTFARKNAALQTATAVKHPERILNQIKFTNALSTIFGGSKPTEKDLMGIPPWASNALGFKLSEGKMVSKFGFPIEEFVERVDDPIKTTLTSLNPLIKFPTEAQIGYDFFRGKPIEDLSKVKEPTAKILMHEKTPQWLKDAFHVSSYEYNGKTYYKADPENLHILRNLPTSRLQNTVDKLFEDGVTDMNPKKIASFIIGAQIYDIDTELQKHFRERDLIKDYQKELEQRGAAWDWTQWFTKD